MSIIGAANGSLEARVTDPPCINERFGRKYTGQDHSRDSGDTTAVRIVTKVPAVGWASELTAEKPSFIEIDYESHRRV